MCRQRRADARDSPARRATSATESCEPAVAEGADRRQAAGQRQHEIRVADRRLDGVAPFERGPAGKDVTGFTGRQITGVAPAKSIDNRTACAIIAAAEMSEFLSLHDAVAGLVRPGDTVALEGFTHLIPFAAGHEIIRQGIARPHAHPDDARPALRPDDRLRLRAASWCSRGAAIPASARCTGCATRSSAAGRGRSRSKSTATRRWRTPTPPARRTCRAAFFRGYVGSDLADGEPEHQVRSTARSPASGSRPSRRIGPTSTIIHAQKADRAGNVLLEGIVGVQKEAVLAARAVDRHGRGDRRRAADGLGTNAVVLPSWTVTRHRGRPGRRPPVVRAWLLRARQRVLRRLGRHRARPRQRSRRWIAASTSLARRSRSAAGRRRMSLVRPSR